MIRRILSKREKAHVWRIDLTIGAQRIRQQGYATRAEAENAIAALRLQERARRLGLPVPVALTLGHLLDARQSDRTFAPNNPRAIRRFQDFVDFAGPELRITAVTSAHLKAFRDQIARSLRPSSVATYLSYVIGSLNAARTYYPELETYRAPGVAYPPTTGRHRVLTRAEFRALVTDLRTVRPDRGNSRYQDRCLIATLLEMLIQTGARVGELLALKPAALNTDGVLTIDATKTHTVRLIPVSDAVAGFLEANPQPFARLSYETVRLYLRTSSKRLKMVYGDRLENGWVIHDLRHTAASILAEAGTNSAVIAALLGHKLPGTTSRYTHATMPALRQAVKVLEIWCSPKVVNITEGRWRDENDRRTG